MIMIISGPTTPHETILKAFDFQRVDGRWIAKKLSSKDAFVIRETARHWPGVQIETKEALDLFGIPLDK